MNLQTKILAVLVPLVTLPIAFLGTIAHIQQQDSIEREAQRQLRTVPQHIEQYFTMRIAAIRADVLMFSRSATVKRYLLTSDEGQRFRLYQPGLLKLLGSYQEANPEYYEIRILLPDGFEDTRSTLTPLKNVTDEEAATAYFPLMFAAEDDILVQILRNPDNGDLAAYVSARIALSDPSVDPILVEPTLRGFLVVTMSLDFLSKLVISSSVGEHGHILVADESGQVLFAPARLGKFERLETDIVDLLKSHGGTGEIFSATHLEEEHLLNVHQLQDDLYILAALPNSKLAITTDRLKYVTALTIVGAVLFTSLLLFLALRFLVLVPLGRLAHAIGQLACAEPLDYTAVNSQDEIGELAKSFKQMSRSLYESHQQVRRLAFHDSLTGLTNRRFFAELLDRAVTQAQRDAQRLALLFLDIDDFKKINDSLGHNAGDALLCEMARRLEVAVRRNDEIARGSEFELDNSVARLGGDEFTVLLPGLQDAANAASVAERIFAQMHTPFVLDNQLIQITTSIGITVYPDDGVTVDQLIQNADIAMYQAKASGKNTFRFFTEDKNAAFQERVALENDLKNALDKNELVVFYQPQIDTVEDTLVGIEAVVRWRHPERGMLLPGEFIPLAEETDLVCRLDTWVLHEACRQNREWQLEGLPCVPVAVNISHRELQSGDLKTQVSAALTNTGLLAEHLVLELTETSIVQDVQKTVLELASLKSLGIRIALDEFGTGYSSLRALKSLPIDCLKIDRSFVRDIDIDEHDAAIVSMIIAMTRTLGVDVIAEGVEKQAQLEFILSQSCTRIQGFLVSPPASANAFEDWLRDRYGSLAGAPPCSVT